MTITDILPGCKANPDYKEIILLHQMLMDAGIPHEYGRNLDGWQIRYRGHHPCEACSAIEHRFSYGADADKIEIMGLTTRREHCPDGVRGWLSAENVFKRIRKDWEK